MGGPPELEYPPAEYRQQRAAKIEWMAMAGLLVTVSIAIITAAVQYGKLLSEVERLTTQVAGLRTDLRAWDTAINDRLDQARVSIAAEFKTRDARAQALEQAVDRLIMVEELRAGEPYQPPSPLDRRAPPRRPAAAAAVARTDARQALETAPDPEAPNSLSF